MNDRYFSESVQYQALLANLEQNKGQLKCALCGKLLFSKAECHFDHVLAYAKGGRSTPGNCQILCAECNLSKSDKDVHEFLMEEKAKRLMAGESIDAAGEIPPPSPSADEAMTKERFDSVVGDFIKKRGTIKKVDFLRDKNRLPSISYVREYYGSVDALKLAFGLEREVAWSRETVWARLVEYSKTNPNFRQSELTKGNGLPSLPCILSHYPEFKSFTDIKLALGLELNYELWTKEKVLVACQRYLERHSKITLKDLRRENGLPTSKVVYKLFGTMQRFQEEIGSEVSRRQAYLSEEALIEAAQDLIGRHGAVFASRAAFLELFPYSQSVILDRFGTFDSFIGATGITIQKTKKAKYSKQEVDDLILSFLKQGNPIPPSAKHLASLGLPSSSTILRFYDDWKEPFVIFSKMILMTSK